MKGAEYGLLVCAVILVALSITPTALHWDRHIGLQVFFNARGHLPAPHNALLLTIDRKAAQALHLPPQIVRWPRQQYAKIIQRLNTFGAKNIVLDIAFKESRPEQDHLLAKAIRDAGNVILFTYMQRHTRRLPNNQGVLDIQRPLYPPVILHDAALASASFTLPTRPSHVTTTPILRDYGHGLEPTQPLITLLAQYRPAVNYLYEQVKKYDSSNRGFSATVPAASTQDLMTQTRYLLSVGHPFLESFRTQGASTSSKDPVTSDIHSDINKVITLLTRSSVIHINFYGASKTLNNISVADLFSETPANIVLLRNAIEDKIVFLGIAENIQTEQTDTYTTVFSGHHGTNLSGVEISASVFANLFHDQDLTLAPIFIRLACNACLLLCLAWTFLWVNHTGYLALAQWAIGGIFTGLCYVLFLHAVWLPALGPCIAGLIFIAIKHSLDYQKSRKQVRHTLNALSHFMPMDVAQTLSLNMNQLEKKHQLVEGACLMTDIQGFTRLSETTPPEELHHQLNCYYSLLVESVTRHGGIVANIVGDSLLALWTGPHLNQQLCQKALDAADDIFLKMETLRSTLPFPLTTSMALHGGKFSLGNLGGLNHFEYAPVGDIINTTSRIESFNRQLNTQLLCSITIYRHLTEQNNHPETSPKKRLVSRFRYLGEFTMRNKMKGVELFEVSHPDKIKMPPSATKNRGQTASASNN